MIEEALYTYLTGYAALAALVGARVYPMQAPQDAIYPLVVYQQVSGPREYSHSGPSNLAHPRFQFTAWAATFFESRQVAAQVRAALGGYAGTVGTETLYAVFIDNEVPVYDDKTKQYGSVIDAMIWHKE